MMRFSLRNLFVLLIPVLLLAVSLRPRAEAASTSHSAPAITYRHPKGSVCILQITEEILNAARQAGSASLDRTVEVEIGLDYVLPYLTTDTGTLEAFTKAYGLEWFVKMFPGKNPSNISWSYLTKGEKKAVLNAITHDKSFSAERKIKGLKLIDGDHPFKDFEKYVEAQGPEDMGNVNAFELHLRKPGNASDVASEARNAAKQAGRDKQGMHVHIPFRIRTEALKAKPFEETIKHTDYYRRTELFSQMTSIFEMQNDLTGIRDETTVYFDLMENPAELQQVAFAFFRKAFGGTIDLKQKNYVGIRGEKFYDQPDLWGIEARTLFRNFSNSTVATILDGIEHAGQSENFGLEANRVAKWLDQHYDLKTVQEVMQNPAISANQKQMMMLQPIDDITKRLYPDYYSGLKSTEGLTAREQALWKQLKTKLPGPQEAQPRLLTLIMHDWSKDILFFDKSAAILQIQMARINAMRKLMRDEPIIEVTRAFLLDSGIYKGIAKSLGIDVGVITP
jgi:hypothetical protein